MVKMMNRVFRIYFWALLSLLIPTLSHAPGSIKVEAPNVVGADERFNVTFIIVGEKNP